MAWVLVIVAGLLEVGFATLLYITLGKRVAKDLALALPLRTTKVVVG